MNNEKELTHIDLFSGIGGFTLAAEWAGFKTVVFCEKEKFCQKVLKKRFGTIAYTNNGGCSQNIRKTLSRGKDKTIPDSKLSSRNSGGSGIFRPFLIPEIRDFDGTKYRGTTLLTGGFPCQPFSVAGQRRGKEDDRYLWPEMLRVISEAKPRWILAENVPGIFRMALDTVLADLEGEGYTTGTFIIPACGLNAPHRRNRVWIVAHNKNVGLQGMRSEGKQKSETHGKKGVFIGENSDAPDSQCERPISGKPQEQSRYKERIFEGHNSHAPDTEGRLVRGIRNTSKKKGTQDSNELSGDSYRLLWQENWYEVATRFCRVDDGIPDRVHRLKALGNAIVPQIAYQILKNIAWIERNE